MSDLNAANSPSSTTADALRRLPAVDALLRHPATAALLDEYPRSELVRVVRDVLDAARAALLAGEAVDVHSASLALEIRQRLRRRSQPNLRRVINATGIVLHTGLGRAPLAREALDAIVDVAAGYSALELDLETGERGDRHACVRELLTELTGADEALVVNNNAAATFLALHALAANAPVIVSRGELVEIGGAYRMPDIMAAAGCTMVEVGTTNRTRVGDYRAALRQHETAAVPPRVLLKVHTSNYRIAGFSEAATIAELAALATEENRRRHAVGQPPVWVIDDLGSGLLEPQWLADASGPPVGIANDDAAAAGPRYRNTSDAVPVSAWGERSVRASLAAGADLVLFSGDKLLGGPQAGVIVGRRELCDRLRASPLMRTFRPDKLTLAALEATLRLYRDPRTLAQRLPVAHLLLRSGGELAALADDLAEDLRKSFPEAEIDTRPDTTYAGGGSLPTVAFPTTTVHFAVPGVSSAPLAAELRKLETPVICRQQDGAVVFDCRTLQAEDLAEIVAGVQEALRAL